MTKKNKQVGTVGYTAPTCEYLVCHFLKTWTNDAKAVEAERKVGGTLGAQVHSGSC